MALCSKDIHYIIEKYMNIGWHNLANVFTGIKFGKEKDIFVDVDENILNLLGAIRTYIVNSHFKCYKKENQYLLVSGSSNIISDYDCVIIGKDAHITAKHMFHTFLKKYKNTLSHSFDVNIYLGGIYLKANKVYNKKYVTLYKNPSLPDLEFITFKGNPEVVKWALVKCVENETVMKFVGTYKNISNLIPEVQQTYNNLQDIYKKSLLATKKENKYGKFTTDVVTKYNLQFKYAQNVNDILYSSRNITTEDYNNLIKYISIVQYFSVESLYTYSSTNVIVLEIQNKIEGLGLNKFDYTCSIIENLCDFVHHYKNETDYKNAKERENILLKYSKYIYRIYYSLSKIYTGDKSLAKKTKDINDKVIIYRGTKNKNINFSVMVDIPFNLEKFIKKILKYIDELLGLYK